MILIREVLSETEIFLFFFSTFGFVFKNVSGKLVYLLIPLAIPISLYWGKGKNADRRDWIVSPVTLVLTLA